MPRSNLRELLLQAHDRSLELAIETSIRTGVPLVIEKNGKIVEVPPQYKYVRVPLKATKKKSSKKEVH